MPAIQPVSQKDLIMISSNFGLRSDPFREQQEVHRVLILWLQQVKMYMQQAMEL